MHTYNLNNRNAFLKRSGILSLRLLYRKAQEYFEIENYFEVKRIKSTMANNTCI